MSFENKSTEPVRRPVQPYNSIDEIIEDPNFIRFLEENIKQIREKPDPKPGCRYKRSWYDRMIDAGQLNLKFFLCNILSVWKKQSALNSETRNVLLYVCGVALQQTIKYYSAQNQH